MNEPAVPLLVGLILSDSFAEAKAEASVVWDADEMEQALRPKR